MESIFEGSGVALITPMNDDLTVNYEKLEELIEEQIAEGTDALIACGTTGEASTLTHEEHLKVIQRTVLRFVKSPDSGCGRKRFQFDGYRG